MFDVDVQGGQGVLKIEQFSWMSYVYRPLIAWFDLSYFSRFKIKILLSLRLTGVENLESVLQSFKSRFRFF